MHIQTILKTVLERRRRDYYGVVLKASEVFDGDDLCLCKMAAVLVAILQYRHGKIDPLIADFTVKCLNKYPNLIHAFTRIGVNPPDTMAVAKSIDSVAGDSGEKSVG